MSTHAIAVAPHTEVRSLAQLPLTWRERAAHVRRWTADEGAARAYELVAQELDEYLAEQADQLYTIAEAAALVGRHRDTIGKAVQDGRLTNHGVKHRPRVRHAELRAVFPRSPVAADARGPYDPVADARSILGIRRGER